MSDKLNGLIFSYILYYIQLAVEEAIFVQLATEVIQGPTYVTLMVCFRLSPIVGENRPKHIHLKANYQLMVARGQMASIKLPLN